MHDPYLHVDAIETEKPGLWPWLIGLISFALLALCVSRDVSGITNRLQGAIGHSITAANAPDVRAVIDGRDVTLTGSLTTDVNREALVTGIAGIEGVRVVRDELQEFDPREQAKLDRLKFRQNIEEIDASTVAFAPNGSSLSADSHSTLMQVTRLLRASPQHQIKISGHTDNSGNAAQNLELSRLRAQSVAQFLLANGVNENQLLIQGYGDTKPKFDNSTSEGRSRNRRIEFVFIK